jgi:hypothetical protein
MAGIFNKARRSMLFGAGALAGFLAKTSSGATSVSAVANSPSDRASDPQQALLAPSGASLVGFVLSSVSAVKTTVLGKLRERPSLLDFMTDEQRADVLSNKGSIDVGPAVQAAIDAYVDPVAPAGTYLIDKPLRVTSDLQLKGKKRKTIFRKTSTTTDPVTRKFTTNGDTRTLTWDEPVVFNLICPNESYLVDINIDGISFDLPANGSVGAFDAKRVAYSSFRNLYCNNSKFFAKGYDVFEILWENIRTRFSKNHFMLDTGTSNTFRNVACDLKNASGGRGFVISNLDYSEMSGCAADSMDICYDFSNSRITMNGCGSESFSRLLRATNGANITINGGALKTYKVASAKGTYSPYEIRDANTQVTMSGTWLGIANPASAGGSYEPLTVSDGAKVALNNIRKPIEIGSRAMNWWSVSGIDSLLTIIDDAGARYINALGPSRLDGVHNLKAFEYSKTIPAGSAQPIFRIGATASGKGYGDSFNGRICVHMINGYGSDLGFSGYQRYAFSGFREKTATQNLNKVEESISVSNAGGGGFGGVSALLVRNADNTIDFQLNVANAPAVVGDTTVYVFIEYMTFNGTKASNNVITGL